jgi:pantothenate kinase-related protein Tda10
MERPVTIKNGYAILHSWKWDSQELIINHTDNLKKMEQAINDCHSNYEPLLIGIEGGSGSGKTLLAKVLANSGNNVEYLNIAAITDLAYKPDLSKILIDHEKTYIVDEAGLTNTSTLHQAITNIVSQNGVVVLLYQHEQDLPESVRMAISFRYNLLNGALYRA